MENARDKAPPSWRRGKIFGLVSFSPGGWWRRGVERSSDDAQYSRRRRFFFFSGLSIIPPPPSPAQDAQISPTHTHTQPKWRRLRLCATFFYILFYFFKDFFLSQKMDRIPLHFFVLLWRLSITGKLWFSPNNSFYTPTRSLGALFRLFIHAHKDSGRQKSPPGSALVSLLMQRAAKSSTVIDDFKKSRFFLCFFFNLFVCFSLLLRIFFLFRPDVYPLSDIWQLDRMMYVARVHTGSALCVV